ncbi:MAG: hypothetical protein LWW75_08505 [Chlorobiales bacterium]|nr:hypothetical protein [Chlorobiales bacterium]
MSRVSQDRRAVGHETADDLDDRKPEVQEKRGSDIASRMVVMVVAVVVMIVIVGMVMMPGFIRMM